MSAADDVTTVTLDDLLFNRKREPFSRRALFAFLETKNATELLDFWMAALDQRNMFEPHHPRSSFSMNNWKVGDEENMDEHSKRASQVYVKNASHKQELNRLHAEAQLIMCSTYIVDDAPLCINISDQQRSNVLAKMPKIEDAPGGDVSKLKPSPGLFDGCMQECEKLIRTNYLSEFLAMARKHDETRPKHLEARPPPPKEVKKKELTHEQIARIVPKEPPPPSSS